MLGRRWPLKDEWDLATALAKDEQRKQNLQGQGGLKKKKKAKKELLENSEYLSNNRPGVLQQKDSLAT